VWLLKPAKPSAGAGAAAQVPTHLTPSCMAHPSLWFLKMVPSA
jgi:hypothetical protein